MPRGDGMMPPSGYDSPANERKRVREIQQPSRSERSRRRRPASRCPARTRRTRCPRRCGSGSRPSSAWRPAPRSMKPGRYHATICDAVVVRRVDERRHARLVDERERAVEVRRLQVQRADAVRRHVGDRGGRDPPTPRRRRGRPTRPCPGTGPMFGCCRSAGAAGPGSRPSAAENSVTTSAATAASAAIGGRMRRKDIATRVRPAAALGPARRTMLRDGSGVGGEGRAGHRRVEGTRSRRRACAVGRRCAGRHLRPGRGEPRGHGGRASRRGPGDPGGRHRARRTRAARRGDRRAVRRAPHPGRERGRSPAGPRPRRGGRRRCSPRSTRTC